ncbi:MAG: helix-turn-helix transcriptional regulator [Vallitaleaceae bacterium]|nr:helix-turn-helix transcriptional regulator [Vallitaleaceae bacterium]
MNTFFLNQKTPDEYSVLIANRLRDLRKQSKLSQSKLSDKSNVSLGSIKRFENCGEISLKSLIKIAIALDVDRDLELLFAERKIQSIQEVIDGQD